MLLKWLSTRPTYLPQESHSVQESEAERGQRQEHDRQRERASDRQRERDRRQRGINQTRQRLRKQLTLLKDIMTRDVLLTRNFHLLCKYLRLNRKSSSHNLTISAGHASLCLVFGIVRLVHLDWAFHNFLWVHLQLNTFHCDSPSPLSDLSIAHHSPHLRGGQELQQQVLRSLYLILSRGHLIIITWTLFHFNAALTQLRASSIISSSHRALRLLCLFIDTLTLGICDSFHFSWYLYLHFY